MSKQRVEVARLKHGYTQNSHVVNVVFALVVARRTVEVTWDSSTSELVFTALVPLPRYVERVVEKARRPLGRNE